MDSETRKQLQGAIELLADAVDSAIVATATAHQEIAAQPYAVLASIAPIAAPVRVIEAFQRAMTAGVYQAVRGIARASGAAAACVVQAWPAQGAPCEGAAAEPPGAA